jgi:hypothetical protein
VIPGHSAWAVMQCGPAPIDGDYPDHYEALPETPRALARPLASGAHTGHYAPPMPDALVSVYVRPEGAYITPSDRTSVGVWMESDRWEFVPVDEPSQIGEVIAQLLRVEPRVVPHPQRNEFSALRAAVIAPVLSRAKVRSWTAFASSASLVHVDPTSVTPMRRDGRGYSAVSDGRRQLEGLEEDAIGLAVLSAAEATA